MRLTIVTGASANHGQPLCNLLQSIRRAEVDARVIAYDLGLTDEQRAEVATLADELRRFEFERHPDWVDINKERGEYAWKPIIISDIDAEFGAPVLWLDAGDLAYERDIVSLRQVLARQGFYSPASSGTMAQWTHPATLRYMDADLDLLGARNRNASIVGFDTRRPGIALMLRTWRRCALTRACIAPPGSSRDNHRQDQALLSVLAHRFQRSFLFEVVNVRISVSSHNDGTDAQALDARLAELRDDPRARVPRLPAPRLSEIRGAQLRWLVQKAQGDARAAGIRAAPTVVRSLGRDVLRTVLPALANKAKPEPAPRERVAPFEPGPPVIIGARVGGPRVALVGQGTLPIPPQGWGATQRVIWNLHTRAGGCGIDSLIFNCREAEELLALCEQHRPDVIHAHGERMVHLLAPYLARHPTPLVLTSHDPYAQALPPKLLEAAARVDTLVALSPTILARLVDRGVANAVYVPNGVDTEVFRPLAKTPKSVAALAANRPRKRLAAIAEHFVGRPDYHLTICGPFTDATDRARALPRAANITVLGSQPEEVVAKLLGESEYFVHLSEIEASALVVREAMAAGCKVWTVPYNAQDLENVSLFWQEAIDDPTLGERARNEAVLALDWRHVAAAHAEVYRETLARWRARGAR